MDDTNETDAAGRDIDFVLAQHRETFPRGQTPSMVMIDECAFQPTTDEGFEFSSHVVKHEDGSRTLITKGNDWFTQKLDPGISERLGFAPKPTGPVAKILHSSLTGKIDKPLRGDSRLIAYADVKAFDAKEAVENGVDYYKERALDTPSQQELALKVQERELLQDMKSNFGDMGKTLIGSKMELSTMFQQSAMEGGPSTTQGALLNLLEASKIGIRALSAKVGVGRKPLLSMLHGRTEMPPEVFNKIYAEIDRKDPTLFA